MPYVIKATSRTGHCVGWVAKKKAWMDHREIGRPWKAEVFDTADEANSQIGNLPERYRKIGVKFSVVNSSELDDFQRN